MQITLFCTPCPLNSSNATVERAVREALYFKWSGVRGDKYNFHQRTSEDKALNEMSRELFIL